MSTDDPDADAQPQPQPTDPATTAQPPVRRPRRAAAPGGAGLPSMPGVTADGPAPVDAAAAWPPTPSATPEPADVPPDALAQPVPTPVPTPTPPAWGGPDPGWGPAAQAPQVPGWGQAPPSPGWGQPAQVPGWGQGPPPAGWGPPPQPPAWGQAPPPGWSPAPGTGYPPPRRGLPLGAGIALFAIIAVIVAAAVAVPLALTSNHSSSSSTSTATPNAAAQKADRVFQQALAAANASAGYHYVAVSTGNGESQTITGDAGQQGGRQDLTFGAEQFTLILVGDTVYFEGNTPALEDQLGVPTSSAAGLNSTWISVAPGDGPYAQLEEGITVSSSVQEIVLDPTSVSQVTTSSGTVVTRISGTLPADQGGGTAHLDVAPTTHLPIAYASSSSADGVTETDQTTFTAWGTAPTASAPAHPTAWSSLGASEPDGGYGSGNIPSAGPSPTATPSPTANSA